MAKLEKILEACENFKLESEVALLESTELTELVRAQSKLMIHENMNYIKNALTKGKVLEETQNLLANAWTQVICEDMGLENNYDMTNDHITNGKEAIKNFAQNVGSVAKSWIPTGNDVDNYAKNIYSTGKSLVNEYIPTHSNNDYNALKDSQSALAANVKNLHNVNTNLNNDYNNLNNDHNALKDSHGALADNVKNLHNDNTNLSNTLNKPGANIGSSIDKSLATNPISTSAGLIASGAAAGYGAYKAGQKVKRALFN